jgi:pyruvate dehydrogenase E1 component alpha subunit
LSSRYGGAAARQLAQHPQPVLQTPFKGYLCSEPENSGLTSKEEMLRFYEVMQKCRRMEIVSDNLYKQRLIRGFCHLYDGQEAVAVGMLTF